MLPTLRDLITDTWSDCAKRDGIGDVRHSSTGQLIGTNFPYCLIAEALVQLRIVTGDVSARSTEESLLDALEQGYVTSGFNYFDRAFVPDDLDTAASLTRLLFERRPSIVAHFDEIVAAARLESGLVRTWVGENAHDRSNWFSGAHRWHVDVNLNVCLTHATLGRPVEHIMRVLAQSPLRNYWYIQALHTPFLYARLVQVQRLSDSQLLAPLQEIRSRFATAPHAYADVSSDCKVTSVRRLMLAGQSFLANKTMFTAISSVAGDLDEPVPDVGQQSIAPADLNFPIYWTLGFNAYSSMAAGAAALILALTIAEQETHMPHPIS